MGPACGCESLKERAQQGSLKEHEEEGIGLEGPRKLVQCVWVFYEDALTRLVEDAEALHQ